MMKNKVLIVLLLLLISACTPRLYEIKRTEDIMGTFVTITVHHYNKEVAEIAVDQAFNRIKQIDDLLSNYKEDSEVSILNTNKSIANPSNELKTNIEKSIYYGDVSNGGFDITVQPILDLYTKSFSENLTYG